MQRRNNKYIILFSFLVVYLYSCENGKYVKDELFTIHVNEYFPPFYKRKCNPNGSVDSIRMYFDNNYWYKFKDYTWSTVETVQKYSRSRSYNKFLNSQVEIEFQKPKVDKKGFVYFAKYLIGCTKCQFTKDTFQRNFSPISGTSSAFYIHWVNINRELYKQYISKLQQNKQMSRDFLSSVFSNDVTWDIDETTLYIESNLPESEIRHIFPNTNATFRQRKVDSILVIHDTTMFSSRYVNPRFYYNSQTH